MALSNSTQKELESYLCGWLDALLERKKAAPNSTDNASKAKVKPFHESLLPDIFVQMSDFERSFSTTLGTAFEGCAEIIARTKFQTVTSQHKTVGNVPKDTETEIGKILHELYQGRVYENYENEVRKIVDFCKSDSSNKEERIIISDLYVMDKNGAEIFFEMKSPKPNKEQCINITRKHLWIHAIRKKSHPRIQTYFGMSYNPYGEGNKYKHSFAVSHIDVKNQVLIGKQFWDFLGGDGAYEDLLTVFKKVGKQKSKTIKNILRS